jgi:hypothetical protein
MKLSTTRLILLAIAVAVFLISIETDLFEGLSSTGQIAMLVLLLVVIGIADRFWKRS